MLSHPCFSDFLLVSYIPSFNRLQSPCSPSHINLSLTSSLFSQDSTPFRSKDTQFISWFNCWLHDGPVPQLWLCYCHKCWWQVSCTALLFLCYLYSTERWFRNVGCSTYWRYSGTKQLLNYLFFMMMMQPAISDEWDYSSLIADVPAVQHKMKYLSFFYTTKLYIFSSL